MTAAFVVIRKIMDLVNYAIVIVTITAAIRRSGDPAILIAGYSQD